MTDIPRGARTVGTPIAFTSIQSRNPVASLQTPCRLDPFWDALWRIGQMPQWDERDALERRVAVGAARTSAALLSDPAAALDRRLAGRRAQQSTLSILGVLDQWRTATAEQVAALSGVRGITGRSEALDDLFSARLIDIGTIGNVRTLRPSATDAFDKNLRPRITYPEWVSVTGGLPFDSSRQYTRHNLLATELGLRLAEYAEVEAVLGEKLATQELLGHTGIGYPAPERKMLTGADLVVMREDGLRIAIEITASRGSAFNEKVRRWAKLLHQRSLAESGLVVIFLTADHPDKPASKRWNTRNGAMRAVHAAMREFPGTSADRTAARIGVADWREWFPERGQMSSAFLDMTVDVATGESSSPWERSSFLDMFDLAFSPTKPEAFLGALDNMAVLRGNPHWLRARRSATEVFDAMVARSDYKGVRLAPRTLTPAQQRHFAPARTPLRLRSGV